MIIESLAAGAAFEKLLNKSIDVAADVLEESLKKKNEELRAAGRKPFDADLKKQPDNVAGSLRKHLELLRSWSDVIAFTDLKQPRKLGDSFVPLHTYVMPVRTHQNKEERKNRISLDEALAVDGHCVLLGQPGAGKTTSLQKIVLDYFAKGKALRRFNYPILVRLRDLDSTDEFNPIISAISQILPLGIHFPSPQVNVKRALIDMPRANVMEGAYHALLESLKVVILLDGFDEIASPTIRDSALAEIRRLAERLSNSKLILTCRSGDYTFEISGARKFELSPLSLRQVKDFALKWLPPVEAEKFIEGIKNSPYGDAAMRPLTIAHLCALYQRTGRIPDKPKYVYRKIAYLLLEEWDNQRSVKRASNYAGFEQERKLEFLSNFAFILTAHFHAFVFDSSTLYAVYSYICEQFGLPREQGGRVVKEIESHTGLVHESYHRHFEFAHKSMQEYLAAEYIIKLPSLEVISSYLHMLPAELAIAVALSSAPSAYFQQIALVFVRHMKRPQDFAAAFSSRLELEKPELMPSERGLLAACALITLLPEDRAVPKVFLRFFGAGSLKQLKDYQYVVGAKRATGYITLTLSIENSELPHQLNLPAKLFARI